MPDAPADALPAPPGSPDRPAGPRRRRALAAGLAGLALVALVVADRRAAAARDLVVVSGLATPLVARVDGGPPVTVAPGALARLTVAEGRRRVEVEAPGRAPEALELEVATDPWWARLWARPVWVVNPGGAAALLVEEAVYGAPAPGEPPAAPPRVEFGAPTLALAHVDAAFEPLPEVVHSGDARPPRRVRLALLPPRADVVLGDHGADLPPARRLAWCALRLGVDPGQADALAALVELARGDAALRAAALAVLEPGLARRPVEVAWHRAWQDLRRRDPDGPAAVEARARALLAAHPDDAALEVLVARVEPRARAARARYARALTLDPASPWAAYGLAWQALALGEAEEALRHAGAAARARPEDEDMAALLDDARLATLDPAQARTVREAAEAALVRRPRSTNAAWRALQALAVEGAPPARLDEAARRFADEVDARDRGDPLRLGALVLGLRAALAGDGPAVLARAEALPPSQAKASLLLAGALLAGRADDAAAVAAGPLADHAGAALALAVLRRADPPEAARWRAAAAERLARAGKVAAAELLRAPPDDLAALDDAGLPAADGALLAAALAAAPAPAQPGRREALVTRARRLARPPTPLRAWLLAQLDALAAGG